MIDPITWRDIEDVSDSVRTRSGVYVRGREGVDVTFYFWNGWLPHD